jgi:integrase/recombinase XerD
VESEDRATAGSRLSRVRIFWRRDGLKASVVSLYSRWVWRFEVHCVDRGTSPDGELTRKAARRFAKRYARCNGLDEPDTRRAAEVALHAWSRALAFLGFSVPPWSAPRAAAALPPLLARFADHQRRHRGIREISIAKQCDHVSTFLAFLRRRHRCLASVRITDVDAFIIKQRRRYSIVVVANICSSLRAFLRFLHATGRVRFNLAPAVQAPCLRRGARPPRGLPWSSVVRLLRSVSRASRVGRRDYALLLLMATYGLGASEASSIRLDDIDWHARTFRVTRPKTGVPIDLPLLAPVARALAGYLRRSRPRSAPTRHLFVGMTGAHGPLASSSAVRHIVRKHASAAGLPLDGIGSHTLRHSHATRQINDGASLKVVGDILGHRSPAVTSTYVRVALDRLREIALPVPSWR